MADITPPVEHETMEQTAFRLMERVLNETWTEGRARSQEDVLDTYAACLEAVRGKRQVG